MSNYWVDRLDEANVLLYDKTVDEVNKHLAFLYKEALMRTIANISDVYDEIITHSAEGIVHWNDMYKYDRYFKVMSNLNKELIQLGGEEIKIYNQAFLQMYEDVQNKITAHCPNPIKTAEIENGRAENVVNSIWCADGKSWSDRVWTHKEQLQSTLEQRLMECVSRGVPKEEIIKDIMNRYNVSFHQAETIVRTELSHIQTQAAMDRYIAAGIEKYEILTADDPCDKACIDANGKQYLFTKAIIGETLPPFHPNCRCTIVPVLNK